jgi:hypothetical protein
MKTGASAPALTIKKEPLPAFPGAEHQRCGLDHELNLDDLTSGGMVSSRAFRRDSTMPGRRPVLCRRQSPVELPQGRLIYCSARRKIPLARRGYRMAHGGP